MTSRTAAIGAHSGRLVDAAFALALLMPAAVEMTRPDPAWLGLGLTAAAAAAMFVRRSQPEAVTLLTMVLVLFGAPEIALSASLFTVAVQRRDRMLALLAAGAIAVLAVGIVPPMLPTDPAGVFAGVGLLAALFIGLPVAAGAYAGARRDLVESLRERTARAEAEQQLRSEQARQAERGRIAREMHDVLAHRISLMALHAGGLEVNPDSSPADVERAAALIGENGRAALSDLRDVLGVLRGDVEVGGPDLAPQPTLADVPQLVAASREAGAAVELHTDVTGQPPALVGRTVYRVVQEGLTNLHKHAPGTAASVSVRGGPGSGLEVELHNVRPVGTELGHPTSGSGMGLVGLRERVELVGGEFAAGPAQHGGFTVRARLPWPR